jgi:hypothetical protein
LKALLAISRRRMVRNTFNTECGNHMSIKKPQTPTAAYSKTALL